MTAHSVLRFSLESEEAQDERRKKHSLFEYLLLRAPFGWDHGVLSFTSVKGSTYKAAQGDAEKRQLDRVTLLFDARYRFVFYGCGVSTRVKGK